MGGRVASMIADEHARAAGLLCLGYPFHPVDKPTQLRTAHLADLKTPTLIVQGTRDPFGTREEVAGYKLSKAIKILWLEDGDHDLQAAQGRVGVLHGRSPEDDGGKDRRLGRKNHVRRTPWRSGNTPRACTTSATAALPTCSPMAAGAGATPA